MSVDPVVLLTIVGMAVVTYATRIGGFLLLSRASLSGRLGPWLHYVPGAVLIAIVAPSIVPARLFGVASGGESGALTAGPAEALAALVTAVVAARFKNLLVAMLVGVATVWVLRRVFG